MATPSDHGAGPGGRARLRSTTAVRERAQQLLARARARANPSGSGQRCPGVVDAAAEVLAVLTPSAIRMAIPYHSRWRHFEAGGWTGERRSGRAARLVAAATPARLIGPGRHQRAARRWRWPVWQYREASLGRPSLGPRAWGGQLPCVFEWRFSQRRRSGPLQADAAGLDGHFARGPGPPLSR